MMLELHCVRAVRRHNKTPTARDWPFRSACKKRLAASYTCSSHLYTKYCMTSSSPGQVANSIRTPLHPYINQRNYSILSSKVKKPESIWYHYIVQFLPVLQHNPGVIFAIYDGKPLAANTLNYDASR